LTGLAVGQGIPNARFRPVSLGFSLLGGGIPLVMDGTVIGAVAAGGGSPAQDADVAQAGADALR